MEGSLKHKMDVMNHLNIICLLEDLDQEVKVQRTYSVIMYLVNVERSLSVEDGRRIMDLVKRGQKFDLETIL